MKELPPIIVKFLDRWVQKSRVDAVQDALREVNLPDLPQEQISNIIQEEDKKDVRS